MQTVHIFDFNLTDDNNNTGGDGDLHLQVVLFI
jgi:hypothetical protein